MHPFGRLVPVGQVVVAEDLEAGAVVPREHWLEELRNRVVPEVSRHVSYAQTPLRLDGILVPGRAQRPGSVSPRPLAMLFEYLAHAGVGRVQQRKEQLRVHISVVRTERHGAPGRGDSLVDVSQVVQGGRQAFLGLPQARIDRQRSPELFRCKLELPRAQVQQAPVVIGVRIRRGESNRFPKARRGLLAVRKVEQSVSKIRKRRGILRLQGERRAVDVHGFGGAFLRAKHHPEISQCIDRPGFQVERTPQGLGRLLVAPEPMKKEAEIVVQLPRAWLEGQGLEKSGFGALRVPCLASRQAELVVSRRTAGIEGSRALESLTCLRGASQMQQSLAVVDAVGRVARLDGDRFAEPFQRRFTVSLLRAEYSETVHGDGVARGVFQYLPVDLRSFDQITPPMQVLRPLQAPPKVLQSAA